MIEEVLDQEGEYSDHPNDSGGATKWGISLTFYRNNIDSSADKEDIKNLTQEEAKKIYKDHFWEPNNYAVEGSTLEDLPIPIGEVVFSYSVNMGIKWGHKLLQQAIKELGYNISEDGWLGPNTIKASKKADPKDLLVYISIKAAYRYNNIVLNNESQKVFLEGWMRRVMKNFDKGKDLIIKEKLDL